MGKNIIEQLRDRVGEDRHFYIRAFREQARDKYNLEHPVPPTFEPPKHPVRRRKTAVPATTPKVKPISPEHQQLIELYALSMEAKTCNVIAHDKDRTPEEKDQAFEEKRIALFGLLELRQRGCQDICAGIEEDQSRSDPAPDQYVSIIVSGVDPMHSRFHMPYEQFLQELLARKLTIPELIGTWDFVRPMGRSSDYR
jgi:hypothetical protein